MRAPNAKPAAIGQWETELAALPTRLSVPERAAIGQGKTEFADLPARLSVPERATIGQWETELALLYAPTISKPAAIGSRGTELASLR